MEVRFRGADERLARREDTGEAAVQDVLGRLARMDERAAIGPWTRQTLELIEAWPGRRAPELAELVGRETIVFKTDVRKLKELGLTVSLAVGYRLSSRGEAVLAALRSADRAPRAGRARGPAPG